MATSNVLNISSAGIPNYSGTAFSAITLTQHAVLIGGASNAITSLALTNGQLAIGSTGADPSAATLTAGTGIAITNGAGTITIATTGGAVTWTTETVSFSAAVDNGYIINSGGALVVATLPATAAIGDTVEIVGLFGSSNGWKALVSGTGKISLGNTQSAATGFAASNLSSDSCIIRCATASPNPNWQLVTAVGNITIT
jgi:hypothetical protein